MMQEVNRPNVKLCLDVRLFYDRQSDDYVRESIEKCGEYIVHTHFGAWNFTEDENGEVKQDPAPSFGGLINYEVFFEELQNTGYTGYLTSEYCLPVLKHHQIAGMDEVDHAMKISLKYIRQLVQRAAEVKYE